MRRRCFRFYGYNSLKATHIILKKTIACLFLFVKPRFYLFRFQSPPYGAATNYSSLQHTGATSVQPSYEQTLYSKVYSEQLAAAQGCWSAILPQNSAIN